MAKSKNEEKEEDEEEEKIPLIKRSVTIQAMHTVVEIVSEDPEDNIDKLQKLAVKTIDIYKG